jgi:hypothetical protein
VDAVVNPLVTNDSSEGYEVGSIFLNTVSKTIFMCIDDTVGAAVWRPLETEKNNYSALIAPVVTDDSSAGYSVGSKWVVPLDGVIFFCVDATVGAAVWSQGGGGSGSLDFFLTEDFETTKAADLSVTGTITVEDEEATPIDGKRSIKITQVAGSDGAIVKLPLIPIGRNEKASDVGFKGRFTYSGDNSDIDLVIYDETLAKVVNRIELPKKVDVTTFEILGVTKDNTDDLSVYVEVMTENIGAVLELVNIEGRINPLPTIKNVEINTFTARISSGGSVISQDSDFIDYITGSAGDLHVYFKSGTFTVPPSVQVSQLANERVSEFYQSSSANYVRLRQFRTDTGVFGTGITEYSITLTKQGVDFVAPSISKVVKGQTSEEDIVVECAGNAEESITQQVTDIPFVATVDSIGAWNGTQFTAPDSGIYVIGGMVTASSVASANVELYVNGVKKVESSRDLSQDQYPFNYNLGLKQNDVLSVRLNRNATLLNIATAHHLSITKQAINPIYSIPQDTIEPTVTKILSTNITTDGDVAELQFSDLVIGQEYEFSGGVFANSTSGGHVALYFRSGASNTGTIYGTKFIQHNDSNFLTTNSGISFKFTAVSENVYLYLDATGGSGTLLGNGSRSETFLQLTKRNKDGVVTNVAKVNHKIGGVEYETGELWAGQKIYARSYEATGGTGGSLVSLDTDINNSNIKPIDNWVTNGTEWIKSIRTVSGSDYCYVIVNPTGLQWREVGSYNDLNFTIRYLKL